jgi:hypothetical protein
MDLTGRRQPRHFSLVFPANVSQGDYVLLFRNGQVLRCWPIAPRPALAMAPNPDKRQLTGVENLIRCSISVSNKARSRRSRKNRLGELNADLRSLPPSHEAIADGCVVKHKIE